MGRQVGSGDRAGFGDQLHRALPAVDCFTETRWAIPCSPHGHQGYVAVHDPLGPQALRGDIPGPLLPISSTLLFHAHPNSPQPPLCPREQVTSLAGLGADLHFAALPVWESLQHPLLLPRGGKGQLTIFVAHWCQAGAQMVPPTGNSWALPAPPCWAGHAPAWHRPEFLPSSMWLSDTQLGLPRVLRARLVWCVPSQGGEPGLVLEVVCSLEAGPGFANSRKKK